MTAPREDITLTVQVGEVQRRLPLVALAAALRLAPSSLRDSVTRLVLGYGDDPPRERGNIGGEGSINQSVLNERKNSDLSREKEGGLGEERDGPTGALDPRELANLLGTEGSHAFLKRLLAEYPMELIDEALKRTLAVPGHRITKSRGAYFTAVLRSLSSPAQPPSLHLHP